MPAYSVQYLQNLIDNLKSCDYKGPQDRESCNRCVHSKPIHNGRLRCTRVKPMPQVSKLGVCKFVKVK